MQWGVRRIGVAAIVLAACTACGAGPSGRPDIAVVERSHGSAPTTDASDRVPPLTAPVHDLAWTACTDTTLGRLGLGPGPAGLTLECASFPAPVDASIRRSTEIDIGVMRARLPQTPASAAPLVLSSGADLASSSTLAALATGPASALLERQPIVAVDRRGIGASTPLDCGKDVDRRAVADLGRFTAGDAPAVDGVAALGRDITVACTDALKPYSLDFDSAHAADDLDRLRKVWQVERLGLLGTGNGATVALAYAAKYPTRVGRLVLDSPAPTTVDAATAAEQRTQGREAALRDFGRRCVALNCALGPDPTATIVALRDRAATGGLGTVSPGALLTTITTFLGSPRGDQTARVRELADALAAADRGDTTALQAMSTAAQSAVSTDGQFVARCSDAGQPPGPSRALDLEREWSARYPVFGADAALRLMLCAGWPTMSPPPLPSAIPVPVLVFDGVADPVVGNAGIPTVTGTLSGARTAWSTVTWQGYGHPVVTHSDCARRILDRYLESAALPANGGACPA